MDGRDVPIYKVRILATAGDLTSSGFGSNYKLAYKIQTPGNYPEKA
jgi:hypothetical protein